MFAHNIIPRLETGVALSTLFIGRVPKWSDSFNSDFDSTLLSEIIKKCATESLDSEFSIGDSVLVQEPSTGGRSLLLSKCSSGAEDQTS